MIIFLYINLKSFQKYWKGQEYQIDELIQLNIIDCGSFFNTKKKKKTIEIDLLLIIEDYFVRYCHEKF